MLLASPESPRPAYFSFMILLIGIAQAEEVMQDTALNLECIEPPVTELERLCISGGVVSVAVKEDLKKAGLIKAFNEHEGLGSLEIEICFK